MNHTENSSPWANSGVLLLDPMPLDEAMSSCHALGENLWPIQTGFEQIRHNLQYLSFKQTYTAKQKFWIASVDGIPMTIDGNGHIGNASTDHVLPVLCTQSAPFSTPTTQDTSPKWQVSVRTGKDHITG